jgi:hypothetical protein
VSDAGPEGLKVSDEGPKSLKMSGTGAEGLKGRMILVHVSRSEEGLTGVKNRKGDTPS